MRIKGCKFVSQFNTIQYITQLVKPQFKASLRGECRPTPSRSLTLTTHLIIHKCLTGGLYYPQKQYVGRNWAKSVTTCYEVRYKHSDPGDSQETTR